MKTQARDALWELVGRTRKVRTWLVFLAFLKVAAAGLLFVMLYIAGYAITDHYTHFGAPGRVVALVALGAGLIVLAVFLIRSLTAHISFAGAARHIEGKVDLDQELLTAVEYYEDMQHYPYSKALAEHVVLHVHSRTRPLKFDSTVPKWQGYICMAVIAAGLLAGGLFLRANYVFFATYFTRLAKPLEHIEPLPATSLVALTGEVVNEYGTPLVLEAEIKGRVPDEGAIEIAMAPAGENDSEVEEAPFTFRVSPIHSEDNPPRFIGEPSLEIGKYRYRFTAADAATGWHSISVCTVPKIKAIHATVELAGSDFVEPYTEEVKNFSIEVLKGSKVKLTIELTEPIKSATITGLDGITKTLDGLGATTVASDFVALRSGRMRFKFESVAGISNDRLPELEVKARLNKPPQIELTSPDGDYMATNVASVPIAFAVKDDFGLESVTLSIEAAGRPNEHIDIEIEKGAKERSFTHVLELEDYNLEVGDSMLFYAQAGDIDIGTGEGRRSPVSSDVYFIEIRPYRVPWLAQPPAGAPGERPDEIPQVPPEVAEKLGDLLEYTRAILKKTWTIARKPSMDEEDRARLRSIKEDTDYCAAQLALLKSDPGARFSVAQVASIDLVLDNYDKAAKNLAFYEATAALEPEKVAYRELRKLVDEVKSLCPTGQGTPPERPDRVVVEDRVHVKRYDTERIAEETERIEREIEEAADRQQRMSESFDHFLEARQRAEYRQETTDETSSTDRGESDAQPSGAPPGDAPAGSPPGSRVTVEGAETPPPDSGSASSGPGSPAPSARPASPREQMRMFQARQRALAERVAALNRELARLEEAARQDSDTSDESTDAMRTAAAKLEETLEDMEDFSEEVGRMYFGQGPGEGQGETASRKVAQAAEKLEEAARELADSTKDREADEAADLATKLTELADEVDRTQDQVLEAELARTVKSAQETLRQMESASSAASTASGGPGGGVPTGSGASPVILEEMDLTEAARYLAMRFWTIKLTAEKETSSVLDSETTSAELHKLEDKFFEDTAHYKRGQ